MLSVYVYLQEITNPKVTRVFKEKLNTQPFKEAFKLEWRKYEEDCMLTMGWQRHIKLLVTHMKIMRSADLKR